MSFRSLSPLLVCALVACTPADPDALVRIDVLDGGDDCPRGGVALHTGLDHDRDGALDDAEITESSYVCNGEDGSPGQQGPIGLAGPKGDDGDDGSKGDPGTPGDDGADGDDGLTALVRVDALDPGHVECEFGGVAVHAGLDDGVGADTIAGDGVLQDNEIDDTEYVCDGADGGSSLPEVIEGDVQITNSLDVALLAQTRVVTGTLNMSSESLTTATFPALEQAGGISIQGASLVTWSAPLLTTVVGRLYANVGYLPAIETIDLPVLATVGSFRAYSGSDDPIGTAVQDWSWLSTLVTIEGDMTFAGNGSAPPDLTGFTSLTTIGGALTFEDQGFDMTDLSGLVALETLGSLRLDSSGIVSLGTWGPVAVTGDVVVRNSYFIEDFGTLGNIASIGGNLRLDGNYIGQCEARAVVAAIGRENIGGYVEVFRNEDEGPCACDAETPASTFPITLTAPTGLAFDGQCLWVLTPASNQIHRVDFAGNVLGTVTVPSGTSGIAVANGDLWIGSASSGTVSRLDWDGTVLDTETFSYTSISALGGDSRYLFGAQSDGASFAFLDLIDGGPTTTRTSSLDHITGVTPVLDQRVWLLDGVDDVLVKSFNSGGEQIVAGIPGPVVTLAWDGVNMWGLDPAGTIATYPLP